MKTIYVLSILMLSWMGSLAQRSKEKVTFKAEDGLEITADRYYVNEEYPYILLFHQAGSSRGEFNDIAERFLKLRYNCLAVDLRAGDNSNFVKNETAQRAAALNHKIKYLDALMDIRAAINFAYALNPKPVILLGSSYSASLVMLVGKEDPNVKAVIAFSPGEYFGDDLRMEESMDSISKPLFIAVTQREEPYVRQMMSNIPDNAYTLFKPNGRGTHGASALWEDKPSKDEYWLALLMFINNLNQ